MNGSPSPLVTDSESRTKVALVGVGRWGKKLLRVLDTQAEVLICCNESAPEVKRWLKKHYPHISHTFDYEEVLSETNVEGVVIATPINTHALFAMRALEANKHVFVEKPLSASSTEAKSLAQAAKCRGLVLSVGHVFLYHPVLKEIIRLTQDDPVRQVTMSWKKYGTFEENIFWNLASHEVAIALALFHPLPVEVAVANQDLVTASNDQVNARLLFSGHGEALLEIDRRSNARSKTVLVATESGRTLLWQDDILYKLNCWNKREVIFKSYEEPLAIEMDAFIRRVRSGEATFDYEALAVTVVETVSQLMDSSGPKGTTA